jgi:hypothetical protein
MAIGSAACGGAAEDDGAVREALAPNDALPIDAVNRDINNDGVEDVLYIYADIVDDNPVNMRGEADTTGDGNVDIWVRIADDGETLQRAAYDTTGDGQPDRTELYTNNRLAERHIDENADGRVDRWFVFGDTGAVVESREDSTGTGQPDIWSTYGAGGVLVRAAYDTDGTGQPDRWLNYDETGEFTSIQTDTDGDGIPDEITTPPH